MSIFSSLFSVRSKSSENKKHSFSRSRSLRLESLEDRALLAVTTIPSAEFATLQSFYPEIDWSNAGSFEYTRVDLVNIPSATAATHVADLQALIAGTPDRDLVVFNTAGLSSSYILQLESAFAFTSVGGHAANSAIFVSLEITQGATAEEYAYSPFTVKANSGDRIATLNGAHSVAFGGINFQGTGTVSGNGGAFSQTNGSSNVTFDHVSFTGFSVSNPNSGGVFYSGGGTSEFSNTLFVGNSAAIGGAICTVGYAYTTVDFSTFTTNTARTGAGGGASLGNNTTVTNSIFYGNTGNATNADISLESDASYSNLYVGVGNIVGIGNLSSDNVYTESPFAGSGANPYRLSATSKAIGAASSTNIAIDLAGNARVQQDTADIGAYESGYTDWRYNTYIGAIGGSWNDADNWDRGYVPVATETAHVPTGSTVVVTTFTQDEIDDFLLEDPNWNIYSSKDYVGDVLNNGTIVTEYIDNALGTIAFTGVVTNGSGTIDVSADTNLLFTGDYQQTGGSLIVGGSVGFQGEADFVTTTINALSGSTFFASDGGIVNVRSNSTFSTADEVEIFATRDATLNLDGLKTFASGEISATDDGIVSLPNLVTVTVGAGKELYIESVSGGIVVADRLTTIEGEGDLVLEAGVDSVVNLRSLYLRKDVTLTVLGLGEVNIPDLDMTHVVTVGDDVFYGEVYGRLGLREAITLAAVDGKDITFANYYGTSDAIFGDTIVLTEGEILIDFDATITGLDAASLAVQATEDARIFNVATGTTVSVSGLTLTGGSTTGRGGAILSYGDLTLENMVFTGNESAMDGGAIRQDYGSLTLINVDFDNNTANYGGGVYVFRGSLSVEGGSFQENSAAYGGAVYLREVVIAEFDGVDFNDNDTVYDGGAVFQFKGNMSITGGEFKDNIGRYGAAVYVQEAATAEFSGVDFTNNDAAISGGAIYQLGGNVVVTGGEFEDNDAIKGDAGAVYITGDVAVTSTLIDSAIFTNNTAAGRGGAVRSFSDLTLENAVFTGNSTVLDGGAVRLDGASLTLINTDFDGNEACYGGGVYVYQGSLTAEGGTFEQNTAAYGGAVYLRQATSANFNGVDFSENSTNLCDGGAIYQFNGNMAISGGVFSGNDAVSGGAIYVSDTTLPNTITGAEFSDNTATSQGGAICFADGILIANGTVFEGNAAYARGGAIAQNGGELFVTTSQFLENGVNARKSINTIRGGAVSMVNASEATFSGVDFMDNSSTTDGGAIYQSGIDSKLELLDITTFLGNISTQGGALYVHNAASLLIEEGVFTENIAGYEGGALYIRNVLDATISEFTEFNLNTAGERGGAIFQRDGLLKITDAIFAENESLSTTPLTSGGGAIFLYSGELKVTDSEFTGNKADGSSATGVFKGGGGKLTVSRFGTNIVYSLGNLDFLDDGALNW